MYSSLHDAPLQQCNPVPAPMPFLLAIPLPVRLLVPRTRTWTTELLGLTPSVVCNQERPVVGDECLLQLVLAVLVDVFLIVGDLNNPLSAHISLLCCRTCLGMRLDLLHMKKGILEG